MVHHSWGLWYSGSTAFYYLFIYLLSSASHQPPSLLSRSAPPPSLPPPTQLLSGCRCRGPASRITRSPFHWCGTEPRPRVACCSQKRREEGEKKKRREGEASLFPSLPLVSRGLTSWLLCTSGSAGRSTPPALSPFPPKRVTSWAPRAARRTALPARPRVHCNRKTAGPASSTSREVTARRRM